MFQLPAEDRIRSWRDFRSSLNLLSIDQAFAQTAELWARVPFVPYSLDLDDVNAWPDPWTLIYENHYCDIAKCLGIVYTMLLTEHRTDLEIEFRMYEDTETKYIYNLAWFCQGKYILNMIDGTVLNNEQFNKKLKLIKTYSAEDLHLENY
jgi:hypothetical protein